MNLRFITRDGKRILQQEVTDPVLHRKVWKDVPLKEEPTEIDPGFAHPTGLDHADGGSGKHQ